MSWAHVQGTGASSTASGTTTLSATFASPVTAGNLIVVGLGSFGGGATTVKDSINNTNYSQAALIGSASSQAGIYWYVAPVGGSSFQVTLTSTSSSFPSMTIDEFSFTPGASISAEGAATGGLNNASPAISTPTTTITPSGTDLIFCTIEWGSAVTATAGTNFTLTPFQGTFTTGKAEAVASQYALNRSTVITPSATLSGTIGWEMAAVGFLPTGGSIVGAGAALLAGI